MDAKTVFLYGNLEEEIYMKQLEGFIVKEKKDHASRQWYKKFDSIIGGKTTRRLNLIIVFLCKNSLIMILLFFYYVDDMLITGKNASRIKSLKKHLSKSFAMKDLGSAKQILGIKEKYIEKIFQRFIMDEAKVVSSPLASHFTLSSAQSPSTDEERQDLYAMLCTRLDIVHIHTDDNDVDMLTRTFARHKLEASVKSCCILMSVLNKTQKFDNIFSDEEDRNH
ncbi:Retrovirus-related Pol polyprotein from transposon TNT 1-94-like protein [Drosera capensis]